MEEEIKIIFGKEKANMFYSILLAAATQLNEFDENGFLPMDKLPLMDFLEELRLQIIDHCTKEEISHKNHVRFVKFQMDKAGLKMESIKNDRMADKH